MEIMNFSDLQQVSSKTPASSPKKEEEDMGREAFLTMLVAQLKNQDPLNPVEGTDFTAQLAQFSSLEQIMAVNTNLKSLQTIQNSQTNSMLSGLIGKTVEAKGSQTIIEEGVASDLAYSLDAPAHTVSVSIYTSSGALVKTLSDDSKGSGTHILSWDGKDINNEGLPDGAYSFVVSARNQQGESVDSKEFVRGVISAISYEEEGEGRIWVGPVEVPVKSIIKVEKGKSE
ncbi:MAG: flagellar hook assembly protein FlgD [Nitrospinota bacterium]